MNDTSKAPVTLMIIAIVAILWNIVGVMAFATDMMMTPEMLALLPEDQQELYANNPMWNKLVYGVATICGLIGSIGLAMKKKWSELLLLISLIAVVIQMSYSLFFTNAREVVGDTAGLYFPVMILLIALFLWYYAKKCTARGWLA